MTQIYRDAAQVQEFFTRLFNDVQTADPHGMDSITKSKMVILFRLTDPDVDMWVDGRSKPVIAHFGEQNLKPTITASLSGNALHEILLGSLPLGKAVSGKQLKFKGSLFKMMRLEDLLHQCQHRYPQLAEELLK